MHIPSTIRTSYGNRSLALRAMVRVTLTTNELHDLAGLLARQAADAEREGRAEIAATLAWRAADLREAARF